MIGWRRSGRDAGTAASTDAPPPAKRGRGAKSRKRQPGFLRRLFARLLRAILLLVLLFLASNLLFMFVTPPSTIMLARWLTLQPVARETVPLEAISAELRLMVIASEDGQYCRHLGVDWRELRQVIESGGARGASTISMQTAKNVYLWPQRSYIRKALEIPIAIWLDFLWSKPRMLEIYLNIAEWDEGVFGAEAAAQHYFNRSAADLTRHQAALLATALPAPQRRNPAAPSAGHARLAERLAYRAVRSGPIAACVE
ncbi:MAG: monofunctional biosynthetic peptidoglycan transglycosylase [Saliniramus fredricksonii]|uniref:Biosynthetic peptidoglycan transglycosylase n=1 Tax=Saliniramus fredricksonii TaxID=1653334 RepID=A0A0P7Y4L6_9HYPH|nr:monofunctional biosynthetic peptidoglycan transglycosylase [Saliniramus fredricksonii]KPQ11631.1 MAG: monofunctional biosynthetic peptidoglycan transglycosylase [Saliniramus fredricksonii]SCC80332.1 monofunctional biosynthetic peptidoglycan transglycosylase [Saliniramus fredricksonii]